MKKTDSESFSLIPLIPMNIENVSVSIDLTNKILMERAEYYLNQGFEKYDSEDFLGAVADFTKAIAIVPDYAQGYYYRGVSNYDLKEYEKAINDFSKAIELDSSFSLALNNRGIARYDLKYYEGAIEDYTKAIEINPRFAFAINTVGLQNSIQVNIRRLSKIIPRL
jgi:tetratricopeptide (TPR) repeat protein